MAANHRRSFVPTSALANRVDFGEGLMRVQLQDGRIVCVPLAWSPAFRGATKKQLRDYEIGGGGVSLHWPDLDEDSSVAGRLAGADVRSM